MKPAFAMPRLGKPDGGSNADGGPPSRIVPFRRTRVVQGLSGEAATAVELCDEHQEAFATVPVAWDAANSRLYAQAISYTGENPGIGYLKVTTAGGTDTFGVEFVSA